MTLAYLIELVAATAVGLAFACTPAPDQIVIPMPMNTGTCLTINAMTLKTLAGFALVELVGLAAESARGTRVGVWGIGRCLWSVVGLMVAARMMWDAVAVLVTGNLRPGTDLWSLLRKSVQMSAVDVTVLNLLPVALWITSRLGRWPRDPCPDAREWAGRVFGVVMTIAGFLFELMLMKM
jgi:hypothetical protein